ncbi:MAG: prepilin-type N-terminal cleavage/methylation domain-containing protein [Tissierellaceae bacterium]|nr:prepilin-type N-terminal cleavage/methylation domain-containing protein [Tissierellaceae bacterium]
MKVLNNKRKGITLIEVIIAIAIMAIIGQAVYSIYYVGNKSHAINRDMGFAQQDARLILENINKEMRSAKDVSDSFFTTKYYSISIDSDNNLIKTTYDGTSETPEKLGTNIEYINFIPIDKTPEDVITDYSSNIIKVKIATKEGTITRSYTMDIRFENGNIIKYSTKDDGSGNIIYDFTIPLETVYYTKYTE